ncbi:MAG TPA: hypothetical protein VJU85_09740 [Nitrososphaeraceae archaeon]|nr:hypothetical protein [Nitrososphaeraceae archaeon]
MSFLIKKWQLCHETKNPDIFGILGWISALFSAAGIAIAVF